MDAQAHLWRRFIRHLGRWCDEDSINDLINCVETGSYNYKATEVLAGTLGSRWVSACAAPIRTGHTPWIEPKNPLYTGCDPNMADPVMRAWTKLDTLVLERLWLHCKKPPSHMIDAYDHIRRDLQHLIIQSNDAELFTSGPLKPL